MRHLWQAEHQRGWKDIRLPGFKHETQHVRSSCKGEPFEIFFPGLVPPLLYLSVSATRRLSPSPPAYISLCPSVAMCALFLSLRISLAVWLSRRFTLSVSLVDSCVGDIPFSVPGPRTLSFPSLPVHAVGSLLTHQRRGRLANEAAEIKKQLLHCRDKEMEALVKPVLEAASDFVLEALLVSAAARVELLELREVST